MESRKRVLLGLGSNVGERISYILKAMVELEKIGELGRISTVYESEPWGVEDQDPFLNCVLELYTDLDPFNLLRELKEIEKKVGRRERFRWGPREIDIDILLYEEKVVDTPELKIPHPFIKERDFVLIPMLEVDPDLRDPMSGEYYRDVKLESKLKPFCCVLKREGKGSRIS